MSNKAKLLRHQRVERRKRIPQRTQEILRKMIQRRYAELCAVGAAAGIGRQNGLPPTRAAAAHRSAK